MSDRLRLARAEHRRGRRRDLGSSDVASADCSALAASTEPSARLTTDRHLDEVD